MERLYSSPEQDPQIIEDLEQETESAKTPEVFTFNQNIKIAEMSTEETKEQEVATETDPKKKGFLLTLKGAMVPVVLSLGAFVAAGCAAEKEKPQKKDVQGKVAAVSRLEQAKMEKKAALDDAEAARIETLIQNLQAARATGDSEKIEKATNALKGLKENKSSKEETKEVKEKKEAAEREKQEKIADLQKQIKEAEAELLGFDKIYPKNQREFLETQNKLREVKKNIEDIERFGWTGVKRTDKHEKDLKQIADENTDRKVRLEKRDEYQKQQTEETINKLKEERAGWEEILAWPTKRDKLGRNISILKARLKNLQTAK